MRECMYERLAVQMNDEVSLAFFFSSCEVGFIFVNCS